MMKCLRLQIRVCLILVLGLCLSEAFAQGTVRGKVTSKTDGMPLPGVNVLVKGKTSGTTTDVDGRFSIEVGTGETLTFSYIGYAVQEVAVSSQTELNIALEEDVTNLQELVVTALGITKESRKLGYAVTTVNGDQLNKARETNVALSLAGTVPGLTVRGSSGGPGGTAQLLLRGMPSMNSAGSPLYIINGIPMDNTQRGSAGEWGGGDNGDGIGNLNPDDIETMTVLKGQSASALYGARASNGVILITTKKGKKNDFSVEFNTNYMTDHAMNLTDFQYEYGQGTGGLKPTSGNALATTRLSWGARLDGSQTPQFDGNSYAYSAQRNNIQNFYRMGSTFTNTVSVSKGGESGSFRLSASNLANKSMVPNSGLDRKTINLSIDQKITNKLSVTAVANYIDEQSDNRSYLSDGPLNANNILFLATNVDQKILAPGFDPKTGFETRWSDDEYVSNPYFVTSKFENDIGRRRLISSVMSRYEFNSWLYAQGRVGYDLSNDTRFNVTPWGTAYSYDKNLDGWGGLGQSKGQNSELNFEGIIGINNKKITSDLSIDALIGGNIRKNEFEQVSIGGSAFTLPNLNTFSNLKNRGGSGYEYRKQVVNSGFYSIDLAYKSFLTLNTTGRYDDYSTLYSTANPNKTTGIFTPSVSASFLFTELKEMGPLSFGKLRASVAQTSGELNSPYQTALYYDFGNTFNGTTVGSFPDSAPNSTLNPFTLNEIEIGTELKFFQNRLSVDLAWYTRKTSNEIMRSSLTPASGYNTGLVGTGSTRNTGIEVQLKGAIVKTADFEWSATFNYTNVNNEILSTDPENKRLSLGSNRASLGNAITAYVVGMSGPQIMAYDFMRNSSGQMVVDESGVPRRALEQTPMGSVLPKHYGGLTNQLSYKGISFSFLVDYNFGNKVLSATEHYSIARGLNKMTLEGRDGIKTGVVEDRDKDTGALIGYKANPTTASAQAYYTGIARNITSSNVVDGDFIKLRQLTLGYSIPRSMLGKLPFQSIQVSFVGRNLAILMRKAKNIDPESQFGSNIAYFGIEGTGLPSARSYGFNVNFKFK